jgi:hypothetical protein
MSKQTPSRFQTTQVLLSSTHNPPATITTTLTPAKVPRRTDTLRLTALQSKEGHRITRVIAASCPFQIKALLTTHQQLRGINKQVIRSLQPRHKVYTRTPRLRHRVNHQTMLYSKYQFTTPVRPTQHPAHNTLTLLFRTIEVARRERNIAAKGTILILAILARRILRLIFMLNLRHGTILGWRRGKGEIWRIGDRFREGLWKRDRCDICEASVYKYCLCYVNRIDIELWVNKIMTLISRCRMEKWHPMVEN